MRRFHVALGVTDVERSIEDYTERLGEPPVRVVPGEYALWRTASLNLSIRRSAENPGQLRHLGWEEPDVAEFGAETDANGIVWERFTSAQQEREIDDTWPDAARVAPPGGAD